MTRGKWGLIRNKMDFYFAHAQASSRGACTRPHRKLLDLITIREELQKKKGTCSRCRLPLFWGAWEQPLWYPRGYVWGGGLLVLISGQDGLGRDRLSARWVPQEAQSQEDSKGPTLAMDGLCGCGSGKRLCCRKSHTERLFLPTGEPWTMNDKLLKDIIRIFGTTAI